jgi:hypothetical protein
MERHPPFAWPAPPPRASVLLQLRMRVHAAEVLCAHATLDFLSSPSSLDVSRPPSAPRCPRRRPCPTTSTRECSLVLAGHATPVSRHSPKQRDHAGTCSRCGGTSCAQRACLGGGRRPWQLGVALAGPGRTRRGAIAISTRMGVTRSSPSTSHANTHAMRGQRIGCCSMELTLWWRLHVHGMPMQQRTDESAARWSLGDGGTVPRDGVLP